MSFRTHHSTKDPLSLPPDIDRTGSAIAGDQLEYPSAPATTTVNSKPRGSYFHGTGGVP